MLRDGGLVVFPTETIYGVAALATREDAVQSLLALRGGDATMLAVHLSDHTGVDRYADVEDMIVRRVLRKVFPGPVTVILDLSPSTIERKLDPLGLGPVARRRVYGDGTIALRCPDHPMAHHLLALIEQPVVATMAAAPGQPLPVEAHQTEALLDGRAGMILDGGRCRYGGLSTVVRVHGRGPQRSIKVQRQGVYDERYLRKLMQWTMLLVCTGNTCRSPMAEAIARSILARRHGVEPDALESVGINVMSAGLMAHNGQPASDEAASAADAMGLDLGSHHAQRVTVEMINQADVIYCMTDAHRDALIATAPHAADRIFRLDTQQDVDDPMGQGPQAYRAAADQIRQSLEQRLKEHQP